MLGGRGISPRKNLDALRLLLRPFWDRNRTVVATRFAEYFFGWLWISMRGLSERCVKVCTYLHCRQFSCLVPSFLGGAWERQKPEGVKSSRFKGSFIARAQCREVRAGWTRDQLWTMTGAGPVQIAVDLIYWFFFCGYKGATRSIANKNHARLKLDTQNTP